MRHAKRNVWVLVNNKWEKGYLLSAVKKRSRVNGVVLGGKQRVQVQVRDSQMFTTKWAAKSTTGNYSTGTRNFGPGNLALEFDFY